MSNYEDWPPEQKIALQKYTHLYNLLTILMQEYSENRYGDVIYNGEEVSPEESALIVDVFDSLREALRYTLRICEQ